MLGRVLAICLCAVIANGIAAEAPRTLLELPPGAGNPRNSEGGFAKLPDGRVLFAYSKYVGASGDDHAACVIALRSSRDRGETWSDDRIVARNEVETGGNVMSVSLLPLTAGRLAMFYLRKETEPKGGGGEKRVHSRVLMRESTDGGETWSPAADCSGGVLPRGYYVMNNDRAVRLSSGRIVLPIATGDSAAAVCLLSDDNGKTWMASERILAPAKNGGRRVLFEEPGIVQLNDGSVVLFVRTNTGRQWRAISSDGGLTWGACAPWTFVSPRAPMQVIRLADGRLLAIWNDLSRFPERVKDGPGWARGPRTPLTLAVSSDEGRTWSAGKDLETDYDPKRLLHFWYCYPAVLEFDDCLLVAYCAEDNLTKLRLKRVPKDWLPSSK